MFLNENKTINFRKISNFEKSDFFDFSDFEIFREKKMFRSGTYRKNVFFQNQNWFPVIINIKLLRY